MRIAGLATTNRWLNDPRILPFHHDEPIDLSPVWRDVVSFEFDTGCIAFHGRSGGTWEAHLMLLPGHQGPREKAFHALREMFMRDDCTKVIGRITYSNKRAIRFTRSLGFVHEGADGDRECFSMTREQYKEATNGLG